ncbi:ATP-binding protein [Ramlibacter albus]|nr:ATP-binding protein [Ramlibacter albus]
MTPIEVPPDVARITEGLRDTGYDFNTAVADVIDNSIAAGANVIDVRIAADFVGDILISVADDGVGMDQDGLINAMKYGSKRRPHAKSLGKFGLGLKTASTAFCKRLTLVSRHVAGGKPLKATWDLEEMAAANSWSLLLDTPSVDELRLLDSVAPSHSGTVVLWEKVDRLLEGYKDKQGRPFKKALDRVAAALGEHIALVYQRFLDPSDTREKTCEIRVNGQAIRPWDPFCLNETKEPVARQELEVELNGGQRTKFLVRAFILPRKEEFSSDEARVEARISNERQGVYVYRENRLIHGPDWMGMFKQEPHYSLLRVELSFDHTLDDAFQVDIKKSRIQLNEALYEWLRDKFLTGPRREAEVRYRRGAASLAKGTAALLHTPSSNVIHQKAPGLSTPTVQVVDPSSGKVEVSNKSGKTTATIRIVDPQVPAGVYVVTADSLENGALWEPTYAAKGPAVSLNLGHPYYTKAYLPNKANSIVVQALDYMLWALANAELNNLNDDNKDAFEEFRIEVSRNLKKLVADLPDPPTEPSEA